MTVTEAQPETVRLQRALRDARLELHETRNERDALQAQLEGNIPAATSWLQTKVWRQRLQLRRLERRVIAQRAVLRRLDELGRGLTYDEWVQLRDTVLPAVGDAFADQGWTPPKEE